MLESLNIRPAENDWIRARSEWCRELLRTFQATSDAPKGPIRAYLTYIMGRALLRQKPVARLSAGATLTHFTRFFQQIQFMDDAADRQSKSNPGCMGMSPGWSDPLSSHCAQEMRTKKFFPNILPTDEKEDPERPQKVAKADVVNAQKEAESESFKTRKKVNHKPAEKQPCNIHIDKDGQTIVTPKPTAKASTAPKAPAAPQNPVKSSSGQKVSHAAQPKFKGPIVSSGRKHGRKRDDAIKPVGGSISQKEKRI